MKKEQTAMNETMEKAAAAVKTINDTTAKAMDEYVQLGLKVQDEMFSMAHRQMDSYREYAEFALKNQRDFFEQFETNAKNTRQLWIEGLKKWQDSVQQLTPKA